MRFNLAAPPQRGAGPSRTRRRDPIWAWLAVAAALAALAACATEAGGKRQLLKRVQPPQPMLMDAATYGGGVLTAESWLGPSVRLKRSGDLAEPGEGPARPGRHARPAGGEYGPPEHTDSPFEQGDSSFSAQEIDEMYGRVNYEYILPPRLALTLVFVNNGAKPLTFTIADVNSALGDFAARPATLTLAPGEHGTPDPMLSNLDSNFEALDVTLAIKLGTATETKVLKLHRPPAPPPAAPAE